MNKILTIIVILLTFTPVRAQVVCEGIDIKTDNSYQYVSSFTSSARKKYANAMKWLEANIKDFDNTIVTDDPQSFSVVFKSEIPYEESETKNHYLVATISVDCRDDKFRVKLAHIKRKTITRTCNYLTPASEIYKTRNFNTNLEMKQFDKYSELARKRTRTADEEKVLGDLKRYSKLTREGIIDTEMKPYIDMQKAIATLIEGIEKAIKGK